LLFLRSRNTITTDFPQSTPNDHSVKQFLQLFSIRQRGFEAPQGFNTDVEAGKKEKAA
jgi:hypothetical protein